MLSPIKLLKLLLIICLVALIITVIKQLKLFEGFESGITENQPGNQPLLNLNANDLHFIHENSPSMIEPVILNYKINYPARYITVFKHKPATINTTTYLPLGSYCLTTDKPIENPDEYIRANKLQDVKILSYLVSPVITTNQYNLIWTSNFNDDRQIISIWRPVCPAGTSSLSDVINIGLDTPNLPTPCIPITMLEPMPVSSGIIWQTINDSGIECYCWGAGNMGGFRASRTYGGKNVSEFPELENVYNLPAQFLGINTVATPDSLNAGITL